VHDSHAVLCPLATFSGPAKVQDSHGDDPSETQPTGHAVHSSVSLHTILSQVRLTAPNSTSRQPSAGAPGGQLPWLMHAVPPGQVSGAKQAVFSGLVLYGGEQISQIPVAVWTFDYQPRATASSKLSTSELRHINGVRMRHRSPN
jgi:hypothetical protein